MPIKPTDLKILSAQIADTIYTDIVVARINYVAADVTGISYQSTEPEDIVIDYDPKNRIVHDIAQIAQTFAWNVHKELEDSAGVPDHSAWEMSKDAAHDIVAAIDSHTTLVHKSFDDPTIVEELVRLILTKQFDDYLVTTDAYALDTELGKFDAVLMQDAFDRTVSFVRHFQDYVTVDDWAGIDKYFTGVKTNFAGVVDHSDYAFAKVLKDVNILSDITLLITNKAFFDSVTIPDAYLVELEKVLADSTTPIDHRVADFLKVLADDVTTPDLYTASFEKVTADTASTSDEFIQVIDFVRSPNDPVTFTEELYYTTNKVLKDLPQSLDSSRGILRKPLADSTVASDFVALAYTLVKADTAVSSDTSYYTAEKVLADTALALDILVMTSQLVYSDTLTAPDQVYLSTTKPFSDSYGYADSYTLDINKDVFETVVTSDALNYSLGLSYADNITAVTDVSKIFKLQPVSDTIGTSDSVNTTTLFSRSFYDTVVLDDFMATDGTMNSFKFNAATTLDNLAVSSYKVLENPCFTTDLPAIIYTKFAQDTVGTQDSYVLSGVKGLTEDVPIIDTVDIVAIVGTTSIFNAFAFNTSTFG